MGATTYLVPPLAVLLGWAILGETPARARARRRRAVPRRGGGHRSRFLTTLSEVWLARRLRTAPAAAATATSSQRSATRRWSSCRRLSPEAGRAHLGQDGVVQPDGLGQGPRRAGADRGRRGEGRDPPGPDDPRADVGQHRHLAGDDLLAQGLPAQGRHARQRDAGAHAAAADVRRRDRLLAGRPGLQRRGRDGARDGRGGRRRTTCPTSTATRPTRTRTTTARRRRSSRSSTATSPRSSPASAPAAR